MDQQRERRGDGFVNRLRRHVIRSLVVSDVGFAEFLAAILSLAWGLWVTDPTHAVFHANAAYGALLRMLPEACWGSLFIFTGLMRLTASGMGWRSVRMMGTLMAAILWAAIAGAVNTSSATYRFEPVYPALALLNCWLYVRFTKGANGHAKG